VNGFNASEVEAMLSAGVPDIGEVYKPDKPTLKAGGVWGTKRETNTPVGLEGGHFTDNLYSRSHGKRQGLLA
jgi:hypothetical protein